jgi:3-deoxy-D-manno-octulosonate 8-phosphate phosphatase (KDO 8-P phosphatase)
MQLTDEQFEARAKHLRLLLFDVDGVLTDGTIGVTGAGHEQKSFYIRDGAAIVWAQRAGLQIGLLSGRGSDATTMRAEELKIAIVIQGETDKRTAFLKLAATEGLQPEQIAYMGDDLLDLPVLGLAGLSAAPQDACEEVRERVHVVTRAPGGRGAVREFIELILRGQGRWDALVRSHLT